MNALREHIIYKCSIVILVAALLTPSIVKFYHIFEDHAHQVCNNNQKTHFHEFDLECEFYKFKLNTQFTPLQPLVDLLIIEDKYQRLSSYYQSIRYHSISQFYLRGPPQLI